MDFDPVGEAELRVSVAVFLVIAAVFTAGAGVGALAFYLIGGLCGA